HHGLPRVGRVLSAAPRRVLSVSSAHHGQLLRLHLQQLRWLVQRRCRGGGRDGGHGGGRGRRIEPYTGGHRPRPQLPRRGPPGGAARPSWRAAAASGAYSSGVAAGSAGATQAYNAGVAAGSANTAQAYNAGVAAGSATSAVAAAAPAPTGYVMGGIYPTLPAG